MITRIGLHVLFWGTYLFLKTYMGVFLFNYSYFDLALITRIEKALVPELIILLPKMMVAYFIMYSVIPRIDRQNRWRLAGECLTMLAAALIMYHLLMQFIIYPFIYEETKPAAQSLTQAVSRHMWRTLDLLTVVGAACTFRLMRKQLEEARRSKQLVEEKLQSELNFLRAQLNPHFLFNTLNNIYALARKQAKETPEVVMQLSKLLRYTLYECSEKYVPLEKEWRMIEDYVQLEKLRYGNRVKVNMQKEVQQPAALVAPLLMLPLVENAFKHGAGNNYHFTEITLRLVQHNRDFHFTIKNNFEAGSTTPAASNGIGLQNVKRQLELLYPEHSMQVSSQEGTFVAGIQMKLHEETAMPHR
jgi:hypothetical protein